MIVPWTLFILAVTLGATAASQGATVIAVSQLHLGRPTSIAESFAAIKGRIVYLALIMIGYGIGVTLGLVLLIIPGIILGLMWALTIPVAVLEDKGLRDSLDRSATLTKGHRGRVFVIYILFFVLMYAAILAWAIPLGVLIAVAQRGGQNIAKFSLWFGIGSQVGSFFEPVPGRAADDHRVFASLLR